MRAIVAAVAFAFLASAQASACVMLDRTQALQLLQGRIDSALSEQKDVDGSARERALKLRAVSNQLAAEGAALRDRGRPALATRKFERAEEQAMLAIRELGAGADRNATGCAVKFPVAGAGRQL